MSLRVQPYPDMSNIMYCMRTLTRHSQRNYMKPIQKRCYMYTYSMDTCSILCCNNTTILST